MRDIGFSGRAAAVRRFPGWVCGILRPSTAAASPPPPQKYWVKVSTGASGARSTPRPSPASISARPTSRRRSRSRPTGRSSRPSASTPRSSRRSSRPSRARRPPPRRREGRGRHPPPAASPPPTPPSARAPRPPPAAAEKPDSRVGRAPRALDGSAVRALAGPCHTGRLRSRSTRGQGPFSSRRGRPSGSRRRRGPSGSRSSSSSATPRRCEGSERARALRGPDGEFVDAVVALNLVPPRTCSASSASSPWISSSKALRPRKQPARSSRRTASRPRPRVFGARAEVTAAVRLAAQAVGPALRRRLGDCVTARCIRSGTGGARAPRRAQALSQETRVLARFDGTLLGDSIALESPGETEVVLRTALLLGDRRLPLVRADLREDGEAAGSRGARNADEVDAAVEKNSATGRGARAAEARRGPGARQGRP